MPDRILLGLEAWGCHGVYPSERELPMRLLVDLEIETDLREAGLTDDLANSVDYVRIAEIAKTVVSEGRQQLLEAIAETIAERILAESRVEAVKVRVGKPNVPVAGFSQPVFVEISRAKGVGR